MSHYQETEITLTICYTPNQPSEFEVKSYAGAKTQVTPRMAKITNQAQLTVSKALEQFINHQQSTHS